MKKSLWILRFQLYGEEPLSFCTTQTTGATLLRAPNYDAAQYHAFQDHYYGNIGIKPPENNNALDCLGDGDWVTEIVGAVHNINEDHWKDYSRNHQMRKLTSKIALKNNNITIIKEAKYKRLPVDSYRRSRRTIHHEWNPAALVTTRKFESRGAEGCIREKTENVIRSLTSDLVYRLLACHSLPFVLLPVSEFSKEVLEKISHYQDIRSIASSHAIMPLAKDPSKRCTRSDAKNLSTFATQPIPGKTSMEL
ncbi:hypothetical protein F4776DRAFT_662121 [Hypoxylon sp. NC0597]|nr:hypothetical protein F4776DRAFT_662121 [Hypoxylon sp. NC0597]